MSLFSYNIVMFFSGIACNNKVRCSDDPGIWLYSHIINPGRLNWYSSNFVLSKTVSSSSSQVWWSNVFTVSSSVHGLYQTVGSPDWKSGRLLWRLQTNRSKALCGQFFVCQSFGEKNLFVKVLFLLGAREWITTSVENSPTVELQLHFLGKSYSLLGTGTSIASEWSSLHP